MKEFLVHVKCLSGPESACVDTMGSKCVLLVNPVHAVVVCDLFPVHCRLFSSQLPSADQRQTNLIISELIQPVTTLSG